MSRPRVYVCRPLLGRALDILREGCEVRVWPDPEVPPPRDVLLQEVREAEGLVTLVTDRVDETLLSAARRLRVVANVAVGYDNVDVEAATRRGVVVTNTPDVLTETTADLAWALLLAAARRVAEGDRFTRAGRWQSWGLELLLGQDVYGRTLGVVGLGRIGRAVARRALGFGMRVLYTSQSRHPEAERELGVQWRQLDDLLAEADFVSLHTPLTPQTRHLIGREQLRRMKPTAVLVNTARGPVVDEDALVQALREGWIWAAGLDVFEREPLPPDSPLLSLDNVVLTPHVGSASFATRARMSELAAENCVAVLSGRRPPNPVNPQVLDGAR
ncbi:MAG: glyoxylate reductase [Armatimonadota bacterium]|nr:D-glycerate dehydrogenase [Armatimonadota bacterium]MDW8156743.1 glyoxylate reductase [Armatimonadota bacterium]